MAKKHGIKLYHIFSDEWIKNKEIVKSKIKNILGLSGKKIYARKCDVREITTKEKNTFLLKTNSPIKKLSADLKSAKNFDLNYEPHYIWL